MSWYKTIQKFTKGQQAYIKLLEENFMVRDVLGRPIPYHMTDYQKEFHAASINVLGNKANDILFIKARGISFTFSSLIDIIVTAASYETDLIPIITQRYQNGLKILKIVEWIIKHCKIREIREGFIFKERSIKCVATGCVIEPYPSANAADSIRGMRLIRGLLDEFAFQQKDEDLFAAAQDCIQGDFGQWIIGSTPAGRTNLFFKLVNEERSRKNNSFTFFELPVFDPKKFNPKKSILEQDVEPIAPWISIKKLETKRRRDWRIFMQENMCDFLDDSIAFIPYRFVMNSVVGEGMDGKPSRLNHRDTLFRTGNQYETTNPIVIGCDVAENTDFFAVTAYELFSDERDGGTRANQVFLDYFRGVTTPELYEYMKDLIHLYEPTLQKVRIDRTGVGTGLYGFLKKDYGSTLIEGIHFSSTMKTGVRGDRGENIKKIMSVNLKQMIESGKVSLLQDDMQVNHLVSIDYSLNPIRDKEKGHGDIFFANALALLRSKYSFVSSPLTSVRTGEDKREPQDYSQMSVMDRINFYKRQQKFRKI